MKKNLIMMILLALVVGGLGFFAGMTYQKRKQPAFFRQLGERQGIRAGQTVRGFRPVQGEIISEEEKSITVKLQDGSSKIIILSETTQINKAEKATKDELKVGEKVAVFGTENSDGSITAQNIQLNPEYRVNPSL